MPSHRTGTSLPNSMIDRDAARRAGCRSSRPDTYNSEAAAWPEGSRDMDPDRHTDNNSPCYGVDRSYTTEYVHICRGCGKRVTGFSVEDVEERIRFHQEGVER